LVTVVTEKRWQLLMLMSQETVQNHQLHQITLWAASALSILRPVQQQASFVGTNSLIIALSAKVASVMEF
jgi:hypothetical protein